MGLSCASLCDFMVMFCGYIFEWVGYAGNEHVCSYGILVGL